MKPEEIRAIALKVAKEMGFRCVEDYILFATRFIAAITEKAEPVAWLVRDQVDGLRYPCNQKNPAGSIDGESEPLFTHPTIEPAPQQASRDLQHEHTMNQFKEVCHGRNCKANKAQPTHSDECKADHDEAVGAAPLPDEVAQMVELLRDCSVNEWRKNRRMAEAADMIERLARQVPPDCVVVPWAPTEVKNG